MTVEKLANSLADVVRENSELEKKNRLLIDANKRLVGQRDKAMKLAMTLSEAIDKNGEAFLKIIDHQPPGPPPVPLRPTPEIPEDNEEEEEEDDDDDWEDEDEDEGKIQLEEDEEELEEKKKKKHNPFDDEE